MKKIKERLLDRIVAVSLLSFFYLGNGYAQEAKASAQTLFQDYQDRLYQIRTIDNASGSKSSIGSAFAMNASGILATNYHVISSYLLHPEKYTLEALDWQLKSLPIRVEKVDVINDLALVRLIQVNDLPVLQLADSDPAQGESIYSLGNPRDLGMTVVPGTYSGKTAKSYYDRVLFSGSINPGMSGGPVLNSSGKVIGVNVATSGNQISFLVPLDKLRALSDRVHTQEKTISEQAFQQLKHNQTELMTRLLQGNWRKESIGETEVVGELTDFISCWGESQTNPEQKFKEVLRRCRNQEYIYIAPDFYTGIIELEFFWYESETLSSWQFYRMLNDAFGGVSAGNTAAKEHVTEFSCQNNFVQSGSGDAALQPINKSVYCVRQYKQFPGLFDVLYLAMRVTDERSSLVSHYTISGIEQTQAQEFLRRFLDIIN